MDWFSLCWTGSDSSVELTVGGMIVLLEGSVTVLGGTSVGVVWRGKM